MKSKSSAEPKDTLATIMAYIALLILCLLPFHALITTWAGSNFGYIDIFRIWKELLTVLLGIGCLLLLIRDDHLRNSFLRSKITLLIAAFTVIGLLRTAYGYTQNTIGIEAAMYGIVGSLRYVAFFLVVWIISTKSIIMERYWKHILLLPAAVVIIFGLLQQFLLPKDFLRHFGYGRETIPAYQSIDQKLEYVRLQSTLRGPNPLGAYLVLVITALVAFFHHIRRSRLILGGLLLSAFLVLFFSYSRSAWIGVSASLLTYVLLGVSTRQTRKIIVICSAVALLIIGASIYTLRNNDSIQNTLFHTDENSQSSTSTNEVRNQAISDGIKDVIAHPLGQGFGSAGPASMRGERPKIAENYYIQVAQEVGIFGLVMYISIIVIVGYRLLKQREKLLAQILFASLVGILVLNMVSHAWMDDTLSLVWWGLVGVALAPVIINNKHEKQTKNKNTTI